ncbi:hypothetical protein Tco_0072151 [Tanacetum coccineum]
MVEAKLSSRGSTSVASMRQALSCMSRLSSRGSVRQCTSSDGDNAAPCLPRGLAVLDWLDAELKTLYPRMIPFRLEARISPCPEHPAYLKDEYFSQSSSWCKGEVYVMRTLFHFHMPWRHPDSCITDKIPTDFNQDHVDRLKAHIVKLRDIPEGVLVRSGLSRVWRNPMCDPVLRRSDNTAMSIHDFLCMPSLEKATVREEPHELGTSILSRVADHTTPPAPAGTGIPRASPEEIAVTRPDRNVVAKADHVAKRKTSTGPEISTNTTKRTRLSQKVSGAGSSGLAAGDEVEQTDDATLDDDDQRDGLEFVVEDVRNLNDVGKVGIYTIPSNFESWSLGPRCDYLLPFFFQIRKSKLMLSCLGTRGGLPEPVLTRLMEAMYQLLIAQPSWILCAGTDERDLLPFAPGPYYLPYPYEENDGCESPPYTKDDWDEIHGVNLGLRKKELYKGIPCQLITHGRAFHARYDHSLREVERLAKRCAQQTQTIKKQTAELKQHKESAARASEEVSGLKAELGALKSKCEATEHKLSSWDKKHRKYRSERDTLAKEKAQIEEELKSRLEHRERQAEEIQGNITSFFQSDFAPLVRKFLKSSEFNRAFAGVLNTAISVGVERGLRMGRTDEEFRGLSQRVTGFIPDAKEKFDRVIAAFPDATFPFLDKVSQHSQSSLQDIARLEPDRVTPSSQPSSVTASLRTSTHARHSTSSSGTFGHTSTPEHLKKKKRCGESQLAEVAQPKHQWHQFPPLGNKL